MAATAAEHPMDSSVDSDDEMMMGEEEDMIFEADGEKHVPLTAAEWKEKAGDRYKVMFYNFQ